MMGATRPGFLPGMTEAGAGSAMERRQRLMDAANGFKTNQKAQAAGRQINRNRQQRAQATAESMQRARQQALLEMMHAHVNLGIPLNELATAVGQGMDPMAEMEAMRGPMDNTAAVQPPGMPLAGSLGV